MNVRKFNAYTLFLVATFAGSCRINDLNLELKLGKIDLKTDVDTIESYPARHMYLVNLIHNHTFGRFSMNYAIIRNTKLHGQIVYNLNLPCGDGGRVSKRYVACVKSTDNVNWGWFRIQNGKISKELPGMKRIIDSVEAANPAPIYVKDLNGFIFLYLNGKVVKKMNYGQFVVANGSTIDFDSLAYNLYGLDDERLRVISVSGDDLFKQQSGIFYIPSPGYGIVSKYDKWEIMNIVDSVSQLNSPPSAIEIMPVR